MIFLFRLLKIDTVFCYDPWAHDGENLIIACWILRGSEFAGWRAAFTIASGAVRGAGLKARAVIEKYYYARHPEITRVVDISGSIEKKIDANLCNMAKGPGGHHGSKLRAEPGKRRKGRVCRCWEADDRTA